jgi:uncharacterized membrane protein YdfJ with MMPL/SSD domain
MAETTLGKTVIVSVVMIAITMLLSYMVMTFAIVSGANLYISSIVGIGFAAAFPTVAFALSEYSGNGVSL